VFPVPSVSELATYSGRPESSYSTFADEALLQATLVFTVKTEITDASEVTGDDLTLANKGILSLADYLYLRQPYQGMIANPVQSETIGSYSYSKSAGGPVPGLMGPSLEGTGVTMFDLAVQYLAKRERAGGVYHEGITLFEEGGRVDQAALYTEDATGRRWVLGPADVNQVSVPWDVNAMEFPHDPGV
jgi:hypothetical protein